MRALRRLAPFAGLAALLAASACGEQPVVEEEKPGVRARFDPTLAPRAGDVPGTWLGFPFPSDHRKKDAAPKLSDFPNPDAVALLQAYVALGEAKLDGFSANGAAYVVFDGPLDRSSLPAGLTSSGALQIVDVTTGSPELGQRRPVRWELREQAGKFVAANMLAVAPAAGFPLREHTTYAVLVTDEVKGRDGNPLRPPALLKALLADAATPPDVRPAVGPALYDSLRKLYAPVRDLLAREGTDPARIAVAAVFTTQSVTGELQAVRAQLAATPAPALRDDAWQTPRDASSGTWTGWTFTWKPGATVSYRLMQGRFTAKNYQEGELPYASIGGALHFVDGKPEPVRDEELRFVLTIPAAAPRTGGCYRLVQVAHGTGGDAYSFHDDGTAGRLAARGLAGLSIDQPLHGPRGEGKSFEVETMSFNYLNPDVARSIFRQSAIDTFQLTRFARESLKVPAAKSPTGQEICFEKDRMGFFGHSQGGLTGSLAAAMEKDVGAWMLSAAGGVLSRTVVERKDPIDIQEAVSMILALPEAEPLTELHPVSTLVQTLVEVTDPVNYAPYWAARREFGAPAHVLLTSGMHDQYTPPGTAVALGIAAGVPLVGPAVASWPELDAAGLKVASAPMSANLAGGTTGGLLQWTNDVSGADYDTHFLVFSRPEAIHASMRFLESAAYENATVIERDPASTDR